MCKILLILILVVVAVEGRCPSGWTLWRNTCYMFSHSKDTWVGAELHCKALDSILLEIPNAETNTFVKDHLKALHYSDHDYQYFTGATDVAKEGVWVWTGSKTELNFKDWGPGQPDIDPENCMVLDGRVGFLWHDYPCSQQRHRFICMAENK